jgi:hypothetical protein
MYNDITRQRPYHLTNIDLKCILNQGTMLLPAGEASTSTASTFHFAIIVPGK